MTQRIWLDSTFGQISSDGERVYAVEELGFRGRRTLNVRDEPHPLSPAASNRLVAYDIASEGTAVWEVGGQAGQADDGVLDGPLDRSPAGHSSVGHVDPCRSAHPAEQPVRLSSDSAS